MVDEMGTRFYRFLTLLAAVVALASSGLAHSQDGRESRGERRALIIAKSNYGGGGNDGLNQNDGKYLSETLTKADWLVTLRERPEDQKGNSEKTRWLNDIQKWCGELRENDVALFYFSGHGVKDAKGKLYFPTDDYFKNRDNPKRCEQFALAFDKIFDVLKQAGCANRIVVLDACHAGAAVSAKSSADREITSDELKELFLSTSAKASGDAPVSVFASSSGNQLSRNYPSMQTSVYTYWFCDAFSSHNADKNRDKKISLNELSDYLNDKVVEQTSDNDRKKQTPTAVIVARESELVFPYAALSHKVVCDKCAERLALEIDKRRRGKEPLRVLVTPAIADRRTGKIDVEKWGKAQTEIADVIRELLGNKRGACQNSFEIVGKNETGRLVDASENGGSENGDRLRVGDLGDRDAVEKLFDKKVDAVVYGYFSETESTSEDRFHYGVRFPDAPSFPSLVENDEYILSDEEWRAMKGKTGIVPETNASPSGRETLVETPVGVATLETAETIAALDEQEEWGENYFRLDPEEREFDVEIRVCPPGVKDPKPSDYRELRQGKVLKDAKYWLPLEIGEKYKIALKNKTDKTLYARVFVDGVSSLDWTNKTIGTMKGAGSGEEKFKIARQDDGQTFERENGENDGQDGGQTPARENGAIDAHNDEQTVNREGDKGAEEGVVRIADQDFVVPWVVAPDSRSKQPIELLGFYSRPSDSSAGNQSLGLRYFKVVPANQSIAGDENDKNIGLITVQFLRKTNKPSKTKGGSVGTGADPSEETMEVTTKTLPPVELAATLQIYYCSKKEFEEKAK